MLKRSVLLFLFILMLGFGISKAIAQMTVDVDLGNGALARYRTPAVPSHIAFLSVHSSADFRNHPSTTELRNRGFHTLGMTTRFTGGSADQRELIAIDVRNAVCFLRSQPGITKVVLIGHSGGGRVVAYYQALMENGVSFCRDPNKLTQCPFSGLEFTPNDRADGFVMLDSGTVNTVRRLNASIRNEKDPFGPAINKTLDPFLEKNGFNPAGDSTYSDHFVQKYSQAQSRRMNGLIQDALRINRQIELGLRDDEPFVISRVDARLAELDLDVHGSTLNPAKLLKNNGTIDDTQIVHTVRVVPTTDREGDLERTEEYANVVQFLSDDAVRSKNSLDDIDWCSSNNQAICNVRQISVPILVMGTQGHYFIRDQEEIYENSASADKDFVVVEGANHNLGNCTACAAFHGTGPYTNVPLNLWNHVRDWANARF
jgi:pimeloyl-ACP methyl ester carboxylesterase